MGNIYKIFLRAKLFDGFVDLITIIRNKKIKTAIVSFAFREYVDFIVNSFKLEKFFDLIIAFEDVKKSKPHPEGVLLVANKFKFEPSKILVVGDTETDMLMGNAAGSETCFFYPIENREIYSEEKTKKIHSTFRVDTFKKLIELFD